MNSPIQTFPALPPLRWKDIREQIRPTLVLGAPVVLGQVGFMLMNAVDTAMVKALGAQATAAVGLGGAIGSFIFMFGLGLLLGLDRLVSFAWGAGRPDECRSAMIQGLWVATFMSLPLTALTFGLAGLMPRLGVEAEVAPAAAAYLQILALSTWPGLLFTALRQSHQATGNTRFPAIVMIVANLVNVAANHVLIFGMGAIPALGIVGAGWATFASRTFMFLVLAAYTWRRGLGYGSEARSQQIETSGLAPKQELNAQSDLNSRPLIQKAEPEERAAEDGSAAEDRVGIEARLAARDRPAPKARSTAEDRATSEDRPAAEVRSAAEDRVTAEDRVPIEVRLAADDRVKAEADSALRARSMAEVRVTSEAQSTAEVRRTAETRSATDARVSAENRVAAELRQAGAKGEQASISEEISGPDFKSELTPEAAPPTSPPSPHVQPVSLKPDSKQLRELVSLGLPVAFHLALETGVFTAATLLAARLGTAELAAHHVVLLIASLTFMVPLGLSAAGAVRVGQALGRGNPVDARNAGWAAVAVAVVVMGTIAALLLVFQTPFLSVFAADSEVIALGRRLLVLVAIFQMADGAQITLSAALRGAGDTRIPAIANFLGHWALGLPLGSSLCFIAGWGALGLWTGLATGLTAVAALLSFWWRHRINQQILQHAS